MSKEKKLEQTQASESNVIEQRLKDSRKAQSANPKKGKKRERKSRYNDKRVQDPIFGKDFKRFKPKAKARDDVMLTLEMNNIPDKVDGVDIKRQLAKEGVHVMDVDIKNDLLTDKRTGKGEIKLRMSKGKQKMVKEKIEGMGIRSLVKKYKNIPKVHTDTFSHAWHSKFASKRDPDLKYKLLQSRNPKTRKQIELQSNGDLIGA